MYQKKLEKDIRCPLEYGLSVFGGKWKSRIHYVVTEGKSGLSGASRLFYKTYELLKNDPDRFQKIADDFREKYYQ